MSGANAPYYENIKVDDVDSIEAADLEAIETGFANVDTDKADKVASATTDAIATLSSAGNLQDSTVLLSDLAALADPTFTGTVAAETLNVTTELQLGGTAITANASELNLLDGVTDVSTDEINYLANVTSDIQGQIDTKIEDADEAHVALGGGVNMDLSAGRSFDKTITTTTTFSFSNIPSAGVLAVWQLELVNGGSQTVNFPASVVTPSGGSLSLSASGTDQLVFSTRDGGTTVYLTIRGQSFA